MGTLTSIVVKTRGIMTSSSSSTYKRSRSRKRQNSTSSSCSNYEARVESGRIVKYDYDVKSVGAKSCAGKVAAADLTQYVWDYKNDENKDLGLEVGAVVHNREWSYGLIKYASLVQVAVSFKAKCTFSFRDEGTTRTLKIVDDTGYTHGELDINIHAGTPCVCAVPRKEKIAVKEKVIRCPQKLSHRRAGDCGTRKESSTTSRIEMIPSGGKNVRYWHISQVEPEFEATLRKRGDEHWAKNPDLTQQQIEDWAKKLATKNKWNDGRRGGKL